MESASGSMGSNNANIQNLTGSDLREYIFPPLNPTAACVKIVGN